MRLASDHELVSCRAQLSEGKPPLTEYCALMLCHPIAGRSLHNYVVLTECPALVAGLGLTENEIFWSRYYWMARFAREWQATEGFDAGLEQSVFKLLESGVEYGAADFDALPEVDAAVERDAVIREVDS